MSHDNQPFIEGQLDLRDQLAADENPDVPTSEFKDADEVINMIADTLAEADGDFIEDIANRVLAHKVTYQEDNLFRVEEPNIEEL